MPSNGLPRRRRASASPFENKVSIGDSRFEPVVVALAPMFLEDVGAAVMLGENVRVIVDGETVEIRDGRRVVLASLGKEDAGERGTFYIIERERE